MATMQCVAHDVFISYAFEDQGVADKVCAALEHQKIPYWIAPRNITSGDQYPEEIEDAVAHSRMMVIVFSQCAADSPNVRSEIHLAFRRELKIVPFRIQEVTLAKGLNYWLGAVHWLDAMTPPLETHLRTLVAHVRQHLGPSPKASALKPDRSSDPEARACHERGVAQFHQQHFVDAIAELTRAIELDPTVAWAFNDRGSAHLERGEFELAVSDFTRGIDLDPTRAWAWHGRACANSKLKRWDSAAADFTEAIRNDPSVAWFFHDRGVAHLELQAYTRALEDFTQALLVNPQLEWAYRNRAKAYQYLGHHELAQADLEMADKSRGKV